MLCVAAFAACGDVPTGPSNNFLIHSPADHPQIAAVATFSVSPSSPDSIVFVWEPALRASRYEIAFWRVDSRESMMLYRSEPGAPPTFLLPVDVPVLTPMPLNHERPDGPTTPMVTHRVALSELDRVLRETGMEGTGPFFFVWSVYAEGGGRKVRSIERHRMVLQR